MLKFKDKNKNVKSDVMLLELTGNFKFQYERFVYLNKRYFLKLYRSHCYLNDSNNTLIMQYIVYYATGEKRESYYITKECYEKLEKMFNENIYLLFRELKNSRTR